MKNSRLTKLLSRNRRHMIKDGLFMAAMLLGSVFLIAPLFSL